MRPPDEPEWTRLEPEIGARLGPPTNEPEPRPAGDTLRGLQNMARQRTRDDLLTSMCELLTEILREISHVRATMDTLLMIVEQNAIRRRSDL